MNQQISFESFVSQLNLDSTLSKEELQAIVFELFVHVRTNTECGLWVDVEGFGSFHPLWYELKKHKNDAEDERIAHEIQKEKERRQEQEKASEDEEALRLEIKKDEEELKLVAELKNQEEQEKIFLAKYQELKHKRDTFAVEQKIFFDEIREHERVQRENKAQMQESIQEQNKVEDALREQRTSLETEKQALALQTQTLQTTQESLQREKDQLSEDAALLKDELNLIKQERANQDAMNDEIKALQEERESISEEQASLDEEKKKFKEDKAQMQESIQEQNKAEDALRKQRASLETEKQALALQTQTLQTTQESLQREKDQLSEDAALLKDEQESIAEEKASLDEEKKKFKEDKKLLREETERLRKLKMKPDMDNAWSDVLSRELEPISLHVNEEKNTKRKTLLSALAFFISGLILGDLLLSRMTLVTEVTETNTKQVSKPLYKVFKGYEKEDQTTEKFYNHTVVKGENLYTLSQKLYKDSMFWPLIFAQNMKSVNDMDKIYPGDILKIPHIPKGSSAQKELALVYVKAYKAYKRLGKDDEAHWLLYWSSQNIDPKLLETHVKDIASDDSKKVKYYLDRFVKESDLK